MSNLNHAVSIHPYFKIHEGQMDACKSFLNQFVEKVQSETKCLFYNFTIHGDIVFCREAYEDAEGVLAHLENVGAVFAEFLKIADITQFEIHGPADQLEQLKPHFADLGPAYFVKFVG